MFQADSKEITEIVFPAPEEEGRLLGLTDMSPVPLQEDIHICLTEGPLSILRDINGGIISV